MLTSAKPPVQGSAKILNAESDLAQESWGMLIELNRTERANWILICQEFDITPPQGYVLSELQPGKPAPMKELANALACDASNITGLVDKLEARGLVERRSDAADRRVTMIAVTKAGAKLRKHLLERMSEPGIALNSLSESDKGTLRDILVRLCVGSSTALATESDLERQTWGLLLQVSRAVMTNWVLVCQRFGITPPQGYVLSLVLRWGKPVQMSELANALACDRSNITGLVDRLETCGLVERHAHPADRRMKMIVATTAGARFRECLLERLSQPAKALDSFSELESRALRDTLKKLIAPAARQRCV